MKELLGKNLKLLRKADGKNLDEWAEWLSVDRGTISRWQNGHAFPDDTGTMEKIARHFNLQIHDLFRADLFSGEERL